MATNIEVLNAVHEVDKKVAILATQGETRQKSIDHLIKIVEGNGENGLVDRVDCLSDMVEYHLDEHKKRNNNTKEKISRKNMWWDKFTEALLSGIITGVVVWLLIKLGEILL